MNIEHKLVIILAILYISLAILIFFKVPLEYAELYKEITKDFTIGFLGFVAKDIVT